MQVKTIVLVLILTISVVLGMHGKNVLLSRTKAISEMKRLLLELKMILQFSSMPVRNAITSINMNDYKAIRPFLTLVIDNEDVSFADSWSSALLKFSEKSKLLREAEIDLLISFGNNFGSSTMKEQVDLLDMTVEYFSEYERQAGEEFKKNVKLKMALPIYAGIIVCIMIV